MTALAQQSADKVDVLAVMDTDGRAVALWADQCVALRKQQWVAHLAEHDKARDNIAELLAADAEYDEARAQVFNAEASEVNAAFDRLDAAAIRRTAAIASCRGAA